MCIIDKLKIEGFLHLTSIYIFVKVCVKIEIHGNMGLGSQFVACGGAAPRNFNISFSYSV